MISLFEEKIRNQNSHEGNCFLKAKGENGSFASFGSEGNGDFKKNKTLYILSNKK